MPSSNTMWSQPINKIHQAVSVAFLARRMALRRRQSCDRLSPHDEAGLAKALEDYIHQKHAASETLWDFGEYGANPKLLEKKTPAIETLLKNHDLWTMILGFMPQAKVRDTYVIAAIGKAMNKFSFVNTTSYPDDLFRSWLAGCIHVQVSHLRNLKRYRARYQYRTAKMSSQDQAAIDLLLDGIVAEVHEGEIAKPFEGTAAEATHLLSRVPEMFLQEATQGEVQHAPTNAFWDQVPSMFKDADSLPCITPRKRKVDIYDEALTTPPLPSARGAIRRTCKAASDSDAPRHSTGTTRAFLERALKGSIRSTCRVRIGAAKSKQSWAEVTFKQDACHNDIIKAIVDAINKGEVTTREAAQTMLRELMQRV